jgi:hypothetical protein
MSDMEGRQETQVRLLRQQFRLKTNPDQTFCSDAACQRERKLRWQRHKLRADPDYAENKRNAQKKWVSNNARPSSRRFLAVFRSVSG